MNENIFLLMGPTGFVGKGVLENLIINNKKFVILERNIELTIWNLSKVINKNTNFIIINCAFDFKCYENNIKILESICDFVNKNKIKINKWVQVSSINAYQEKIVNFPNFLSNQIKYDDKYSQTKIDVDRRLFFYFNKKLIDDLVIVVPSIISGGSWDRVLSDKNCKFIPKDKNLYIISINALTSFIYLQSTKPIKSNYLNILFPKHIKKSWNNELKMKMNDNTYNLVFKFYKIIKKYHKLSIILIKASTLLGKIVNNKYFFIFKHVRSIEINNNNKIDDKSFHYD